MKPGGLGRLGLQPWERSRLAGAQYPDTAPTIIMLSEASRCTSQQTDPSLRSA